MANNASSLRCLRAIPRPSRMKTITARHRSKDACRRLGLLAVAAFLAHLAFAQARPKVVSVDPQSGKANDNVTLAGENLGKELVSAVFLSDDTIDHEAMVVEQAADKIVMKVPQVKSGNYNVSIKVGDQIFILPLRFMVQ